WVKPVIKLTGPAGLRAWTRPAGRFHFLGPAPRGGSIFLRGPVGAVPLLRTRPTGRVRFSGPAPPRGHPISDNVARHVHSARRHIKPHRYKNSNRYIIA